ncbi:MAG TPA: kynureninase [Steroidobacteraceae bacterium]|nr:kynureninase [Steroidobacteraceae bacterium]
MTSPHQQAQALDAVDGLARYRQQFALPPGAGGEPAIYLCGHSLGLMPLAARRCVQQELDDWARLGVLGHHEAERAWIGYAEQLAPSLARITGARETEVVAMNSLSVNLHLLMASFYRPSAGRRCIVIEAGAFPSDRHAVLSQIQWHGLGEDSLIELLPATGHEDVEEAQLEQLLAERGEEIALILWPGVQYRSGRAFDLARIAAAARRAGAHCGFDLAHSIGNVPLELHDADADFAVWCSYKYLNAGPGALGGAFVHSRHQRSAMQGLAGWWGHDPATRFQMGPQFQPAPGAAGWQVSNPPVLSAAPLLASLPLFDAAGMPALRAKGLAMTELIFEQIESRFASRIQPLTPRAAARRGNQLSLRLKAGRAAGRSVFEALGRASVIADWREPDILRVAVAPLYNSYGDVARFCDALAAALESAA